MKCSAFVSATLSAMEILRSPTMFETLLVSLVDSYCTIKFPRSIFINLERERDAMMKLPSEIISFGIEMEFTLAFHQDRLFQVLKDKGYPTDIVVKTLPKHALHILRPGSVLINSETRPNLRSWVFGRTLRDPEQWWTPDLRKAHYDVDIPRTHRQRQLRGYYDEHLLVASKILAQHSLGSRVVRQPGAESVYEYEQWQLHEDYSLVGSTRDQLETFFGHRMECIKVDWYDWDGVGIELVTRKFPIEDLGARREITRYLKAISGEDYVDDYGVHAQKYGGTHCHIGFDTSHPNLAKTLSHIAYLWVIYEPIILRLMPHHRRGWDKTITYEDIHSNRINAIRYTEHQTYFRDDSKITISEFAKHIFNQDRASSTNIAEHIQHLYHIMHFCSDPSQWPSQDPPGSWHKGTMVNWQNLYDTFGIHNTNKPTLEFRFMESTVSADDVWHFQQLCLSICRAGQRMAQGTLSHRIISAATGVANLATLGLASVFAPSFHEVEMSKYNIYTLNAEGPTAVTKDKLFALLDMTPETKEFWERRWNRWNDVGVDGEGMETYTEPSLGSGSTGSY